MRWYGDGKMMRLEREKWCFFFFGVARFIKIGLLEYGVGSKLENAAKMMGAFVFNELVIYGVQ